MDLLPQTLDAIVPNMILQPLVEDSIVMASHAALGRGLSSSLASKRSSLEVILRDNDRVAPSPACCYRFWRWPDQHS